jgi:hypothetical protein
MRDEPPLIAFGLRSKRAVAALRSFPGAASAAFRALPESVLTRKAFLRKVAPEKPKITSIHQD